ncbi:MAG: GGDEF domain-containing protein [Meiothermus sp.]|uniref:GGDEF domain-containing protein n=1 Tax=Meiothermus sp. TaxID=1955249 RepID=UPI0025F3CE73|nr:GGDEF domain-containing protein [Meiothermus sp.]MCS7068433.1 GGDEF domain-containing protein [Meiothermus sp.]
MAHSSESIWPWFHRLYWNTALFGGLALALPQLWLGQWGAQVLAVAYGLATLVAFPLARRYPKAALVAHLAAALGMCVWASQQPWAALALGWNREMTLYASATVATLGLTVLAMFGGLWVMVVAVMLLATLLPHPESGLYWVVWPLWVLGGLVGLSVFKAVHKLEATQQELSKVALRDRQTGLSNRLALEADYERYQALASRSDQPLLFSYWLLGVSKERPQLLQELAKVMQDALRQGDGLYRVGDDQFCGLHIGLVSGHELTERLSRRFPQAQVVWVVCNGLALEEALNHVQELLYRSPRQPIRHLASVPKA